MHSAVGYRNTNVKSLECQNSDQTWQNLSGLHSKQHQTQNHNHRHCNDRQERSHRLKQGEAADLTSKNGFIFVKQALQFWSARSNWPVLCNKRNA